MGFLEKVPVVGGVVEAFTGSGESKVNYNAPEKDKLSSEYLQGVQDRALDSNEAYGVNYGKSIDQAEGQAKGFLGAQPGPEALFSKALQDKAQQRFSQTVNKMRLKSGYEQASDKQNQLDKALNITSGQRQLERQVELRKAQAEAEYQKTRGQIISSLLGAGALVGGAYLASDKKPGPSGDGNSVMAGENASDMGGKA